jgi:hypothetical protein
MRAAPPGSAELSRLRAWSLPDGGWRRHPIAGLEHARRWVARWRGRPLPPAEAAQRAWSIENPAEDYGLVVDGDLRGPDPARAAQARQVCLRMPALAARLLDWLARRVPPLPDGAPNRWVLDHLWFGLEPQVPPLGFMVAVQDEADPREAGESALHIACGWRVDRPDDPLVVHGLRWHGEPWPIETDALDPIRETHALLAFLRDGRLAGVALGVPRAEVERRWGPPVERGAGGDAWGPVPEVAWQGGGSVLVGFDAHDRVESLSIALDRHARGTRSILIAPAIALELDGFSPGLDDESLEALLRAHGLSFDRTATGERHDDQFVEWRLPSGAWLGAWNTDCASGLCEAAIDRPTGVRRAVP